MASSIESSLGRVADLADREYDITDVEVRELIGLIKSLFDALLADAGYDRRTITRITTKLRDAGRRSPPWRPTSSRKPGRPQDGADGNRRNRWLFPQDHKFYAEEITATLVEVRYYLQVFSMEDAPPLPPGSIQECFQWLTGPPVEPGRYRDPIQLVAISLPAFFDDPRLVQSGHLMPLDRGGRHHPDNAFLMLKSSNDLQGNLTLEELLQLLREIVERHDAA